VIIEVVVEASAKSLDELVSLRHNLRSGS
jgi:hypothetical protein